MVADDNKYSLAFTNEIKDLVYAGSNRLEIEEIINARLSDKNDIDLALNDLQKFMVSKELAIQFREKALSRAVFCCVIIALTLSLLLYTYMQYDKLYLWPYLGVGASIFGAIYFFEQYKKPLSDYVTNGKILKKPFDRFN